MRRLISDFPEARTVPSWTLRALREFDPNAEVLYLGPHPAGGRWALGTVQPSPDLRLRAMKALDILARMPQARRGIKWTRRVRLERAKLQGFRIRFVYECQEPDSYIVENVRLAHYDHLRTRDDDVIRDYEQHEEADRAAREKDLVDPNRAKEAWQYAFTRSHAVTRRDTPTPSSVVTTHTPSPAAQAPAETPT